MVNLFLVKKKSEKAGREPFTYLQVLADLGYEKEVLTMDKNIIGQLLGCAVQELYSIEYDKPVALGSVELKLKQDKKV